MADGEAGELGRIALKRADLFRQQCYINGEWTDADKGGTIGITPYAPFIRTDRTPRLDDYLERERQNNETYDATISGQIFDAQARYNLGSLATAAGVIDPVQVKGFARLLTLLQLAVVATAFVPIVAALSWRRGWWECARGC